MKDPQNRDYYPFNHEDLIAVNENKAILQVNYVSTEGHLCGYVELNKLEIPKKWHGNYNADGLQYLNIHGGITLCETVPANRFHKGKVIFGFDCGHAGDRDRAELYDPEYVSKLVDQMENQIKRYAKIIDKWRKAGPKKRCNMMDKIRDESKIKEEIGFGGLIDLLGGGQIFKK